MTLAHFLSCEYCQFHNQIKNLRVAIGIKSRRGEDDDTVKNKRQTGLFAAAEMQPTFQPVEHSARSERLRLWRRLLKN